MKTYLQFLQIINKRRKTKIFHIFNKVTNEYIGEIKWSCGWSQYVSAIETRLNEKMEFSEGCHREVAEFIAMLRKEREDEET